MAIGFSIPNTEIIVTTGQTEATVQDLVNAIREFEDDFQMMANSKVLNASGKFPVDPTNNVFSEIIMTLLEGIEGPWTIRFEDEAAAHTKVTGGTLLATDLVGDPRPVTTNFALTINQSISGTLVEVATGSGLNAAQDTKLDELHRLQGLKSGEPMTVTKTTRVAGDISQAISGDGENTTTVTRT